MALLVFAAASLSDGLDGLIARLRRVAQGESASLTRKRSLVQIQSRLPNKSREIMTHEVCYTYWTLPILNGNPLHADSLQILSRRFEF
jgi:hypothetical protein